MLALTLDEVAHELSFDWSRIYLKARVGRTVKKISRIT